MFYFLNKALDQIFLSTSDYSWEEEDKYMCVQTGNAYAFEPKSIFLETRKKKKAYLDVTLIRIYQKGPWLKY
jgi:hypothetical protein